MHIYIYINIYIYIYIFAGVILFGRGISRPTHFPQRPPVIQGAQGSRHLSADAFSPRHARQSALCALDVLRHLLESRVAEPRVVVGRDPEPRSGLRDSKKDVVQQFPSALGKMDLGK